MGEEKGNCSCNLPNPKIKDLEKTILELQTKIDYLKTNKEIPKPEVGKP